MSNEIVVFAAQRYNRKKIMSIDKKSSIFEKQFLGEILLERGIISQNQLKHALQVQEKHGGYLGKILTELGYIDERDVVIAIVAQYHIPYIAIDQYEISQSTIQLVPEEIANKYDVVPLDRVNDILSVVMADPLDTEAKAELQRISRCRLVPFVATQGEIKKAIHRWYDEET